MRITKENPVSDATISACGRYRYRLVRVWGKSKGFACFIMLNPSTADASKDDPTIRRCIAFARRWGYDGIVVVNLAAFRATDPDDLEWADDPVGPDNDDTIELAVRASKIVVAAWGSTQIKTGHAFFMSDRIRTVKAICGRRNRPLHCLGMTQDGHPRHPLYVKGDKVLEPWA